VFTSISVQGPASGPSISRLRVSRRKRKLAAAAHVSGSDVRKNRGFVQTFRSTFLLATAGIVIVGAVNALQAQAPATDTKLPAFEVAAVKPNKTGSGGMSFNSPPGRFTATNMSLRLLIQNAWRLRVFQLVGGPSWLDTDRFDIVAKTPDGALPDQVSMMLQSLLTERFRLAVHKETRDAPTYALVMARGDGRLGRQLTRSTVDCTAIIAARRAARGQSPPQVPPNPPPAGERPVCSTRMMARSGPAGGIMLNILAGGTTMANLAELISSSVGRMVVDRTGLQGEFDVDLQFAPERLSANPAGSAAQLDDAPSFFTALQEQLGLKLESTKGPVDVLVIDHVEQPTPD
jgi:uncharacterized protein (TIGR03435 family)